jgi:hypothetical protein
VNTEKLIEALASDRETEMPPNRMLLAALLAGFVGAGLLFFSLLGPRGNFLDSLSSWRFVMKFVVSLTLALSAAILIARAMRPDARRLDTLLALAPLLLLGMVTAEVTNVPEAVWMPRLIGHNATACMVFIPLFSLAPLAALLLALRRSAPMAPVWAGALAGLAAAGLGAAFYAAHCPDDSPLFVAVWYTLAVTIVTGLGAVAGKRLLAW